MFFLVKATKSSTVFEQKPKSKVHLIKFGKNVSTQERILSWSTVSISEFLN